MKDIQQVKRVQAKDFDQYSFLSQPEFSPSGAHYVFSVSKVKDAEGYSSRIYLGAPGKKPFPLTSGNKDSFLCWEDDKTILFTSDRDTKNQKKQQQTKGKSTTVFRISIAGGEAEQAFTLPLGISWLLPLGNEEFLLMATVEKSQTDFSLPSLTQKEEEELWNADCQVIEELPFWMNGQGYISGKRTRLFHYNAGSVAMLTPLTQVDMDVSKAVYLPEEDRIYYIGEELSGIATTFSALYSCDRFGKDQKQLLAPDFRLHNFEVNKDHLVFLGATQEHYGLNENPKLYSLERNTGKVSLVLDPALSFGSSVGTDSRLGGGTTFLLEEHTLYFTLLDGYSARLCKTTLAEPAVEYLSEEKNSLDSFSVKDGAIVAVIFSGSSLAEVYEKTKNGWTTVTDFHTRFHEEYAYSTPEHHTVSAPEDFIIDGWVMKPIGYQEGVSYPAILHIHGGPKTVLGEIYHHEMQYWAAKGYFVLYCNPRGSDGKGNEFADIRGKYGTVDYENIMQFLDEMLPLYPAIDPQRIGVTGGSYGGFMTNWIVGHTDRFAAAATQRSISNWLSKTYMSDIGYYFNVDQVLAEPWNNTDRDPKALWKASPLCYAHKAKTPTLLIHSSQDYRCPAPEGYQMFTALKLAGVETKLCLFEGETHELSRSGKPKNRLRRLEEISGWMDRFLKA